MYNDWVLNDGAGTIRLLTGNELNALKAVSPDYILISIDNKQVKAKDCNDDTRYGFVAYGNLIPAVYDSKGEH